VEKMSSIHPFSRLELLAGPECLSAFAAAKVIVFGVGGVGSWCAEGLVRSGIGKLTVVDSDDVCVTNINRQLQATPMSVGKPKVDEITRRLREINPAAEITGIQKVYNRDTKETFGLGGYDYVIDAIDSLSSKVDLIMNASASGATVFSALGAACKIDPTRIKVSSIWKSDRCRLGKFVRKRLRKWGFKGDFLCVWSDEPEYNKSQSQILILGTGDTPVTPPPKTDNAKTRILKPITGDNVVQINRSLEVSSDEDCIDDDNTSPSNKTVNGSVVHVTGIFGFTLSGLVIQDIINKNH